MLLKLQTFPWTKHVVLKSQAESQIQRLSIHLLKSNQDLVCQGLVKCMEEVNWLFLTIFRIKKRKKDSLAVLRVYFELSIT